MKRPGIYQFVPGMTVKDLVEQAEGLKEEVYLDRADLVRTAEDFSKKLTIFSLKDLYKEERPGHYVFSGNEEKNFQLRELDQVMTYSTYEIRGKDKFVVLEGHVKEPGTYVLPENMTLYDLIFSRGGFQDEDFKKRAYLGMAHVFRKSPGQIEETIITFNLGKLLEGEQGENIPLESSDRVVVYSYESLEQKPFVTIEGLVIRPGVYNLAENMTLEDLVLVAGGLRPDAYKVEAVIGRMEPGEEGSQRRVATLVVPVEKDFAVIPPEQKTRLETFDKVVIRNLPDWEPLPVVSVEGEVKYQGSYSLITREERLSSLVRRAGGLKSTAFAEGAVLSRRRDIIDMSRARQEPSEKIAINLKGAVMNPAIFQHRSGKGLEYYIDLSGGYHKDADKKNVVVYLPSGAAARKKAFGGISSILPGSIIEVPFKGEEKGPEVVEVRGAVRKPMLVQFRKGERLDYYVSLCGGYRDDADLRTIVVHFADGDVQESRGIRGFNPKLLPGSVIEVAFKSEEVEERRLKTGDVEVRGAVRNPSTIRFRKGEKLDYYISFCGGYAPDANAAEMVIYLPDGTSIERKGAASFNPEIEPGSVIEIPFKGGTERETGKKPEK